MPPESPFPRQQALFHVLVAYSMYDSENICTPRPCPFQGAFLLVANQGIQGAEVGLSRRGQRPPRGSSTPSGSCRRWATSRT